MIVPQEVTKHLLNKRLSVSTGEKQYRWRFNSVPGEKTRWEESIMANNQGGTNNLVVPQANQALDQLKYEIASEFGVNLGPDTTSRQNGSVGGEITKRLVSYAESQLSGR